jgi:AbrB family looped-hinge helix DNA binding protein
MKATIDAAGRVVIPKEIRRAAGLTAGTILDIDLRDGQVIIEPAALPVRLIREGRFLVAVPEVEVEPLTAEEVERTREALWLERAADAGVSISD